MLCDSPSSGCPHTHRCVGPPGYADGGWAICFPLHPSRLDVALHRALGSRLFHVGSFWGPGQRDNDCLTTCFMAARRAARVLRTWAHLSLAQSACWCPTGQDKSRSQAPGQRERRVPATHTGASRSEANGDACAQLCPLNRFREMSLRSRLAPEACLCLQLACGSCCPGSKGVNRSPYNQDWARAGGRGYT